MDPDRLAHFRHLLVCLRDDVKEAGPHALRPNRTDDVGRRDNDDQPLNEMNQAIASSRNRTRSANLAKVVAAITRIDQEPEEYGLCLECDEPIPPARLELLPFAELCVVCLSEREETRNGSRKSLRDYV